MNYPCPEAPSTRTASLCCLTPSKRPAAPTPTSSPICAAQDRISGGAGCLISFWDGNNSRQRIHIGSSTEIFERFGGGRRGASWISQGPGPLLLPGPSLASLAL